MTWQPETLTREQREERRFEGGRLLKEGILSKSEIARQLGVSRTSVYLWVKKLRSGGIRRLKRRKTKGRVAKLNRAQKRSLSSLLKRGASVAGFETERWTLKRIASLIKSELFCRLQLQLSAEVAQTLGLQCAKTDRSCSRTR